MDRRVLASIQQLINTLQTVLQGEEIALGNLG